MDIRTVFMGSPDFALPVLSALDQHYHVVGVVTQPDRPAGRGRTLTPPPIKRLAEQLGLPCIQPQRLREPTAWEQLQAWAPELIVVAAFGQILRANVLDLPRFGCINIHGSLLPRWRGAAPIQAAILHGDEQSGITIMKMDQGVDTGAVLAQRAIAIQCNDTAETLGERLALLGAEMLLETLPTYLSGELWPQAQPENGVTYATLLKKEDGQLDFTKPAGDLARQVRAFNPWPGAFTYWQDNLLKIHVAHARPDLAAPPGATSIVQGMPALGTIQGVLVLDEIQPAGKKPMPGKVFLAGARGWGK